MISEKTNNTEQKFLVTHGLDQSYLQSANRYFDPVIRNIETAAKATDSGVVFVALSGCQGSGKTTLSDYIVTRLIDNGINAVQFSLDDFYLSKAAREALSHQVHDLCKTRGVPGTHDLALLNAVLDELAAQKPDVTVPVFDKAIDDLVAVENWRVIKRPPKVVILEGWCVGVSSEPDQDLTKHVNDFEEKNDAQGAWRTWVNQNIRDAYEALWSRFDFCLFLKAPSFQRVYEWRLEQEQKMQARIAKESEGNTRSVGMTAEEILTFIQHYQRLTEHLLKELPNHADVVWELGDDRRIKSMRARGVMASSEAVV